MKLAVISCSLNAHSRSRVLAREAAAVLKDAGTEVDFIDLQESQLPFAGAPGSWDAPDVEKLNSRLEAAQGFLFAVPIYTYDVNAAAKNLVELCGGALEGKVAGFACSAGGQASYMSVMSFANSLMLDFRTFVIPRFVYAGKEAVDPSSGKIKDEEIKRRVGDLALELKRVTAALIA
jgi:FMN reductase